MKRRAAYVFSLFLIPASCVPIWRDVKSEDGGFTVEFPGAPEEDVEIQQTPFGEVQVRHLGFVAGRWSPSWIALYMVSTIRPSDARPGADELIDWQYDVILEILRTNYTGGPSVEVEVVDDRSINFNGHRGRALTVLEPDGALTHVRIYYVNGTIYRLMVDDENDARVERFLESFELL